MERNTAEIIVKVYAVLSWIGALIMIIGGSALLVMGSMSGFMSTMMGPDWNTLGAGVASIVGIVLVLLSLVYIYIGVALWQRKAWSRIAAIVLSVFELFSFPLGTLIGAFGIWFFGFDETAKGLFGASGKSMMSMPAKAAPKKKAAKKKK